MNDTRVNFKKVNVPVPGKAYDVIIGPGITSHLARYLKKSRSKRAFVIADQNLGKARRSLMKSLKSAGWESHEFAVEAGEDFKDFSKIYPLYGKLLKARANRDSLLIALGGGSIGDGAGFIAATFLRGIDWVGIPTSLLAQVDSSVGGKTGINHEEGKNLIGAFHQPSLVLCDTEFLKTLSKRDVISGLGEVIKYGIIYDPPLLKYVEQNWENALRHDSAVLTRCIQKSIQWKAMAVADDERDLLGRREVLNFGHTVGHALESLTDYETYRHGEAVILGMRAALAISLVRGHLNETDFSDMESFLRKIPVPPVPKHLDFKRVLHHLANDKKVRQGKLHFVLLKRPGQTVSDPEVSQDDIARSFDLLQWK